jgi:hypothetical protein
MNVSTLLACADESSAGPFITGGIFCVPVARVDDVVSKLSEIKISKDVPADAKIHCRILFNDSARAKSPFARMTVADCHTLLTSCVTETIGLGATWWGGWIDQEAYPNRLQIRPGRPFRVTDKHLKGLAVMTALKVMEHHSGLNYRLTFDPDRTKIDWGLADRIQATHFSRTHPHAAQTSNEYKPLLELAGNCSPVCVSLTRLAGIARGAED